MNYLHVWDSLIIKPSHEKTFFMPYANTKDADQPAHPCGLISVFVIRCLDRIIPMLIETKILRL